ncbi:4'-phosphopantetheinyl transferase superfamily protein [Mycoplasma phocimorsus]|uniref:4'-phosphopantetheinyl transferase superfamily protein n=1 Tax=Mycoplasma phocimorsus TaxID=3045839 RepID=A0AAJ1PSH7_9MOLU|nr:4'-phosphopantetheinyl transferase superfamily protein [Mycoplasma phocimorsus]MDJ1646006.1 4'-phosphopantetheinyl transferase superfamily protein [Mycoplasma phocimorsus]MDJ1646286.1 4'-phosphopantetheinyl transferase superfamily protein [Mycoplasma phocimorsus]MDJ1646890.1 4'-phosphopantetheinyl transferase superfamily protein [Mycoplasma phocimorsus]MDJ1647857.1 4'-phosphopantetheinyl transferase superfamily protein [Mycoplasma phocimorsus]MDJ1648442.1 4'-phosphopantetheinyl transferase 
MIGVDITKISRFNNVTKAFIKRFLSKEEFESYNKLEKNLKPGFLAARWAIKEAIFKADNSYFSFNKINLFKENGRYVTNDNNFYISTSTEDDILIAYVLRKEKHDS